MLITSISVENFRCHKHKSVDLFPSTTVLVGKNGAGKTSIIEAIYIALRGKSFKGTDIEILQNGKDWYKVKLSYEDGLERSVVFDSTKTSLKKQFIVNDKKVGRLKPSDKYPVVIFEPDHLRLLTGSPSRRRQFIDDFISQVDPTYSTILNRYEKILKQRNMLLKQQHSRKEDFFVWDVSLSEYGASIIDRRKRAVELINSSLQDKYTEISRNKDKVSAFYEVEINNAQDIINKLNSNFEKDRVLQYTSIGPHRHDIDFRFNEKLASQNASRGETRSILLALKKVEIDQILKLTNKNPLVLLDDVFSELDDERKNNILSNAGQVVVTATEYFDSDRSIIREL